MRVAVSDGDRRRFADICRRITGEAPGEAGGIGVLREKRLHAAVKRYICPDVSYHEQTPPIRAGSDVKEKAGEGLKAKKPKRKKKYVADLLCGDEIYEIQTGSLYPLREKLEWYIRFTDCHITVIHPVAVKKRVIWLDPESGEAKPSPRLSPRGRAEDILPDLVYISELVTTGRVTLRLLLIEAEEYRWLDGWGREGKRGSSRYELLPVELLEEVWLELPEDYRELLPDSLAAAEFTAAEFAKVMKLRSRKAYLALHALKNIGAVRACGTRGRAGVFELVQK